jgi:hypothetical protein
MQRKRRISAKDFMTDLQAGMTDSALMEKYRLSPQDLQLLASKILAARSPRNNAQRASTPTYQITVEDGLRCEEPREPAIVWIPVFDETLRETGSLGDLGEKGLSVDGMVSEVGEVRTLMIRPDAFPDIDPFELDVVCRWTEKVDENDDFQSGFEILEMSYQAQQQLLKLIEALSRGLS